MGDAKMRPVFSRLHAATLAPATRVEALTVLLLEADAFADRRRLSEGAVYVAACRRYRLLTGTDWRASLTTASTSTWGGQSEHRARLGAGTWECSCGASGSDWDAAEAHAAHVAEVAR